MLLWNQWLILFICASSGATNKPPELTSCNTLGSTTKPSSLSSCLLYYVLEKQAINTEVLRFEATDPENDTVLFSLAGDSLAGYIFTLVSDGVRSTKLLVNALIDKEFIDSTVSLKLLMNDQHGNDGILSVITIIISDINDDPPIFQNLPYICNIKENTNASTCEISEWDYTNNPFMIFSLSMVATQASTNVILSDYFVLTRNVEKLPKPKNGYMWAANISNIKPLDYEVFTFYQLLVTATDAAGLNSTIDVIVNVIDQADNPPIFLNIPCDISVVENSPYGTNITTIQAMDGDRGINNRIKYTLINGSFSQYFMINENTGLVQCSSQNIDREAFNIMNSGILNLTVKATEISNDTNPAFSALDLRIKVIDLNDNKPSFKDIINNTYQATLIENSPIGTAISIQPFCKVEDLDQYYNNVFQLTLTQNGQPFNAFNIFPNSTILGYSDFLILVANSSMLDYEQVKQITFQIVAQETLSKEKLTQSATIVLTLIDANDHAPVFYNFPSEVHVSENASVNDLVTTLHAYDNDTGLFGVVAFYLVKGDDNKFLLDQASGRLLVKYPLDREAPGGSSYCLLVIARNMNGSYDSNVTPQTLNVIVDDVNDNAPLFLSNQYGQDWPIFEYFYAGIHVGDVVAIDKDVGMNANITYSLKNNIANQSINKSTDFFRVATEYDVLTGIYKAAFYTRISLKNSFDSRLGNCFNATLTASDQGTPSKSTDVLITFCIQLINDPPIFVQPQLSLNQSLNLTQMEFNDTSQLNKTLYTFRAVDINKGDIADVRYDIKDTNYFSMNQLNGALSTAKMLNRDLQEQHVFYVLAYDIAIDVKSRLTTSVKVVVTVLHMEIVQPSFPFEYRMQNVSIFQNTPLNVDLPNGQKGAFIQNVGRAASTNVGNFSKICYFILNEIAASNFYLLKESGNLYRTQLLDAGKSFPIYIKAASYQFCNDDTYLWRSISSTGRRRLLFLNENPVPYNASDLSMSKVTVIVQEPPRFVAVQGVKEKMFFIGITTSTKPMAQIFDYSKYTINIDLSSRQSTTYAALLSTMIINSDLQATLAQRKLTKEDLFNLDNSTGVLTLGNKVYFQDQMQGYFSFYVVVSDGISIDKANTTISLLNINQQVVVIFYKNVTIIYQNLSSFLAFLSNRTGWQIVADSVDVHQREDGTADLSMTDLYIHALDLQTYTIIPAALLMQTLDNEWQSLRTLYNDYYVDKVQLATSSIVVVDAALFQYRTSFIAVTCVFIILLIVSVIIVWSCRRMYRLKLKAATAVAFGPGTHGSLSHLAMPGTNQYTFEGSNPIWTGEYNNTAYATSHDVNQSDKDSLDENVIESKKATVDEQERSIEFYADSDTASLTHGSISKLTTSDYILTAAIRDHDREKQV